MSESPVHIQFVLVHMQRVEGPGVGKRGACPVTSTSTPTSPSCLSSKELEANQQSEARTCTSTTSVKAKSFEEVERQKRGGLENVVHCARAWWPVPGAMRGDMTCFVVTRCIVHVVPTCVLGHVRCCEINLEL